MERTDNGRLKWSLAPESGELLHLDALRFVAACAIVVTHSQGVVDLGFRSDGFGIFVDLFFVISGFVISYVYSERMNGWGDYRAFLWRRVARLGPLHWATLAAFVAIGLAATTAGIPINNAEAFDLSCIPANAALLHATNLCPHYSFNGPSWSIGAEAMMYLATPLVFVLMRKPVTATVTLVAIWVILSATTGADWLSYTVHWGAVRAIPSFVLGAFLFYQRNRLIGLPFANAICFGAVLALVVGAVLELHPIALLGLGYLAVTGGIAADLSGRSNAVATRLAPLGQLTYSIYMLHMLVLIVGQFLANNVLGLGGPAHTAFMLTAALTVFPLGYLSLVLFETPARRWITSRRRGSRGTGLVAPGRMF